MAAFYSINTDEFHFEKYYLHSIINHTPHLQLFFYVINFIFIKEIQFSLQNYYVESLLKFLIQINTTNLSSLIEI